ncbi:MAG: mannosyl-3-phosphoglycerate phosphatase [Dehalococcoidia bacterium]|nr:mannosyl-3-phosphoglycerate phosphatase [Dehalococcoidia bacterium]
MADVSTKLVIFTDLDGTLLDRDTYSYEKALPAIEYVKRERIPLVFCSAKTRSEQEAYRKKLEIKDPFIVENGGAVFIEEGYFPFDFDLQRIDKGYQVIELGTPYEEIRRILKEIIAAHNIKLRGFSDMSDEEVAAETGLRLEAARLAKQREYSETLVPELSGEIGPALKELAAKGLNCSMGGRYYNVVGANDKGVATGILINLFRRKFGEILTAAIGDSPNDFPMLSMVDIPILVQQKDGSWESLDLPNLRYIKGIGPEGWTKAIEEIAGTH